MADNHRNSIVSMGFSSSKNGASRNRGTYRRATHASLIAGVGASLFIGREYLGKRSCLYRSDAGERHFLANGEDVLRAAAHGRMVVEFTNGSGERDVYAGAFCPIASPSGNN